MKQVFRRRELCLFERNIEEVVCVFFRATMPCFFGFVIQFFESVMCFCSNSRLSQKRTKIQAYRCFQNKDFVNSVILMS